MRDQIDRHVAVEEKRDWFFNLFPDSFWILGGDGVLNRIYPALAVALLG
ncbi:MAG: hypothetical protein HQL98_05675 [Magnetococcales bacterium]|nr:hypothetical protein [Magnetococcales bacterium]